jgi:hypothetical protein
VNRANPFGGQVRAVPLSFGEPNKLAAALAGVDVLYNTYWVRFNHGPFTHGEAVENTLVLRRRDARVVQARCIYHARGNSRVDVRITLREHAAHRKNTIDGVDEKERSHIGAAICQRTGSSSRPADAVFRE